jgi:hypothetical protein
MITSDFLKFRIFRNPADFGFQFHAYIDERDAGGGVYVAKPVEFERTEPGTAAMTSLLSISDKQAQQIIDELWDAGVRPSNGEGNSGQIGAMKMHLMDMRAIVSQQLGVELWKKDPL